MTALTVYMLKHYIRSQRYFAPVVFYLFGMLLIYSYKPNPIADSYSVTAMLLFFGAAWLAVTVMNTEPAGQKQLLTIHAGSKRKVAWGQLFCAGMMQCGLAAITVFYPVVTGMFERPPTGGEWAMAWLGHLSLCMLGLGISVFFQRSYVPLLSRSLPALIAVLLLSNVQGSLSDHLPQSLQWISVVLPPAFYLIREMMLFENAGIGTMVLLTLWATSYAALLLAIHLWLSGRRDIEQ